MNKSITYKTDIRQAKGLGGTHSGTHHWKWQRISAIALVFLFVWFIYLLLLFFDNPEYVINEILYSPFNLLFFTILINVSIYHGALGFKGVCEDYIHNEFLKMATIMTFYFISFITMCAVIFTLMLNFIVNI